MNSFHKLLIAGALIGVTNAQAVDETGIFFGGTVGYADLDEGLTGVENEMTANGLTGTARTDDSGLGWKAFFGYNFTRHFGLSFGYVDLDESVTDVTVTAPTASTMQTTFGVSGYTLTAIGRFPVSENFELLGKFGGMWSDIDVGITTTGPNTNLSRRDNEGEANITGGVGLKYTFTEHVGVRVEWDRYLNVGPLDQNMDMYSFGFEFTY